MNVTDRQIKNHHGKQQAVDKLDDPEKGRRQKGCIVAGNVQVTENDWEVLHDRIRPRPLREQRRREEEKETSSILNRDQRLCGKLPYRGRAHRPMLMKQLRVHSIVFTGHDRVLDWQMAQFRESSARFLSTIDRQQPAGRPRDKRTIY